MTEPAVVAENLSKRYRIGQAGTPRGTLREALGFTVADDAETLWALSDVSFEVGQGEVIGIVGRNGAGKSTLLKILSRITAPTTGRAVLRGRVASLLEVGTGFHGDLTGRENIYMNGSILGMRRAEIDRKLDEIVAFSGVERFLDTPVKRYSSGMALRLAFAVAAHLDPEILVIDEVLAVGDAEFQQKCLGKIGGAARSGRTVLFVSHNLAAVQALCPRSLLLDAGRITADGPTADVLAAYQKQTGAVRSASLVDAPRTSGHGAVRLEGVEILGEDPVRTGGPLRVLLRFRAVEPGVRITSVGLSLWTLLDERLVSLSSEITGGAPDALTDHVICTIPELPLLGGAYWLNASLKTAHGIADYVTHALSFEVQDADFYGTGRTPPRMLARVVVRCGWSLLPAQETGTVLLEAQAAREQVPGATAPVQGQARAPGRSARG